jgi:hypothetical protein
MIDRHPFGTELMGYASIAVAREFVANSDNTFVQGFFPRRRAA